jgi:hypothetical protein
LTPFHCPNRLAEEGQEVVEAFEKLKLEADKLNTAWKALAQCAGKMVEGVFDPVAYLDNPETDTQVRKLTVALTLCDLCLRRVRF